VAPTPQTTLASTCRIAGVGIHGGAPVALSVGPAPADSGVVFVRTDVAPRQLIPARSDKVRDTRLATVIGEGDVTVSTVEHLMAALSGLGVDNALVELDGPDSPAIGRQRLDLAIDPASFQAEIAAARTFGFMAEVEQLRAMGLGRGATLENTIVVDGDHVLNPATLARPDDFVRHKALDALGDLALIGHPILGRYGASCSGHALNHALVTAVLARPEAWRIVTREAAA
jgi:UDP-3-O-acyl-N-acetylglucosamine deacetylase